MMSVKQVMVAATLMAAIAASAANVCRFTPNGGQHRVLEFPVWSATLEGKPCTLVADDRVPNTPAWNFGDVNPVNRLNGLLVSSISVPEDGTLAFGACADWFFAFRVDGREVYSTLGKGNGAGEFGLWNHRFEVLVGKGRHEIEVELHNGMGDLMFACGEPREKPPVKCEPISLAETRAAYRDLWANTTPFELSERRRGDLAKIQRAIDMTSSAAFCAQMLGETVDAEKTPSLDMIDAAITKVIREVKETAVATGSVAIWYVYDMGTVVKTSGGTVFGIDIACPRDEELADICDFACVTHNHGDHCSFRFVKRMQRKGGFVHGKPVVSGFLCTMQHSRSPKTWRFGDCMVETGVTDHNAFWTEAITPVKITCGEGPGAVTILHAGDGYDGRQLAPFAPVDVLIVHVHPYKGRNGEVSARVVKPDLLILSHAQELSHGFGPGRWRYDECELEASRVRDAKQVIFTVWGEKIIYKRNH